MQTIVRIILIVKYDVYHLVISHGIRPKKFHLCLVIYCLRAL